MPRLAIAAALGLFVLGAATPSHAYVISGTLTGTLSVRPDNNAWNNNDGANLFGGGNLNGNTVVIAYSYDTSYATYGALFNGFGYTENAGAPANSFFVSVTINGITQTADGSGNHSNDFRYAGPTGTNGVTNNAFYVTRSGNGAIQLSNFTTSDTLSAGLFDQAYQNDFVSGIPLVVQNNNGSAGDLMFFTVSSVTGQVVPEPATCAVLGSAVLGLAAARRKRRQA